MILGWSELRPLVPPPIGAPEWYEGKVKLFSAQVEVMYRARDERHAVELAREL